MRSNLEERIGPTVSQRNAAKVLGVSHTAVQRWVSSGDVPIVMDERGHKGVPTRFLIDLAMKVERDRGESGRRHSIEPVMKANRARAQEIRRRGLPVSDRKSTDAHDRAADLALAYHCALAGRLSREQVNEALRTVWRLRDRGQMHPRYADEWERILTGSLNDIRSTITSESEFARDLRQNSPFAGALSEPERAEVLAMARA